MFLIGRRWFDETTGLLAGVVTATCFGHVAMARQALPDLTLAFCVTLTTWSACAAWLPAPRPHPRAGIAEQRWWVVAAAAAAAGGVLAKGPVALALPALVVVPLVGWEYASGRTERRLRAVHLLLAGAVFVGLVVPWFAAMTTVHGVAYLDRFFLAENLDRFATARYNDPRAWWYYLPIIVGGMLPWSPYMLLWLRPVWRSVRSPRQIDIRSLRLAWWTLAPLLFYTISVGKQPRYVLPMLGPLALLLAATLRERIANRTSTDHAFACCTMLAGLVLMLVGALTYRARLLFVEWHPRVLTVLAVAVVLSGIGVCLTILRRRWAPGSLTAAAIVATLGAHYVILATPGLSPVETMAAMITAVRHDDEPYGRHAVFNRNLGFYTKRPFVELPVLHAADQFLRRPDRVLCVLSAEDADQLRARGVSLTELGAVTYLNTGNLNLRTLLDPSPDSLERVVLVTNR